MWTPRGRMSSSPGPSYNADFVNFRGPGAGGGRKMGRGRGRGRFVREERNKGHDTRMLPPSSKTVVIHTTKPQVSLFSSGGNALFMVATPQETSVVGGLWDAESCGKTEWERVWATKVGDVEATTTTTTQPSTAKFAVDEGASRTLLEELPNPWKNCKRLIPRPDLSKSSQGNFILPTPTGGNWRGFRQPEKPKFNPAGFQTQQQQQKNFGFNGGTTKNYSVQSGFVKKKHQNGKGKRGRGRGKHHPASKQGAWQGQGGLRKKDNYRPPSNGRGRGRSRSN